MYWSTGGEKSRRRGNGIDNLNSAINLNVMGTRLIPALVLSGSAQVAVCANDITFGDFIHYFLP